MDAPESDEVHTTMLLEKDSVCEGFDQPNANEIVTNDGRNKGEDGNSVKQMPFSNIGDIITTNVDSKGVGSKRGSNAISYVSSTNKSKGDLRTFTTFADKARLQWN